MDKKEFLESIRVSDNYNEWINPKQDLYSCPICASQVSINDLMVEDYDVGIQMFCEKCEMMYDVWYKYMYHATFVVWDD